MRAAPLAIALVVALCLRASRMTGTRVYFEESLTTVIFAADPRSRQQLLSSGYGCFLACFSAHVQWLASAFILMLLVRPRPGRRPPFYRSEAGAQYRGVRKTWSVYRVLLCHELTGRGHQGLGLGDASDELLAP